MRFVIILIIAFLIVIAGIAVALQFFSGGGSSTPVSVIKSFDQGETWQAVSRKTDGQALPFLDIVKLEEAQVEGRVVLFLATRRNGLYQSFDLGNSWQLVADQGDQLGRGVEIFDLEIAEGQVYVAAVRGGFGLVFKAPLVQPLAFERIFIADSPQERVLAISVGAGNIYLGTSSGGFLRSTDRGKSWQGVRWFSREITRLEVDKLNGGRVWVQAGEKLFFSENGGLDWQDAGLVKVDNFWLDKARPGRVFAATPEGFKVLSHLGESWKLITLPSSQKESRVDIAFANPQQPSQFFVVRGRLLYISNNNGQSWQIRALPTQRQVSSFWINRQDSAMILLGLGQAGHPRSTRGLLSF